jgi:hypothetical protein
MKRPIQHQIDTAADVLFRLSLPCSWIVRELRPDYGLDYEVEIVTDEKLTGITFCVQLKGTTSPKYVNESLILGFEVDKLIYYFERVHKPVFILVADLKSNKCFWLFTQRYVQQILRKQNPRWHTQKSVSLHIPTSNQLPASIQLLQQVAEDGLKEVFILQHGRPSLSLSLQIKDKLYDEQAILDAIKESELEAGELKLGLADIYLGEEKTEKAIRELGNIFEDTKTRGQAEIHIASAIKLVHALGFIDRRANRQCAHIIDLALRRQNECKYKQVVLVAKGTKAFIDFIFSFQQIQSFGHFIEITSHQQRGTDALLKVLQSEAAQTYFKANDDMHSLVSEAIDSNELATATNILVLIAYAYLLTYPFIRLTEGKKKTAPILESASQKLELAKQIAESLQNPEMVCYVLQSEAYLLFLNDSPKYESVLSEMKDMAIANKLPHFQKAAINLSQRFKEIEPLPEEPRSYETRAKLTEDEEVIAIKELAKLSGVDLSDESDEIAQMINLGIRDKNPERVLKFCQHLHCVITSYGLPGELFGLPTAGGKLLYCELKERAIEGMSLDKILEIFKWQHCESCQHRLPHPENWRWSRQWQYERDKNRPRGLQKMLDNLYGRHG